MSWYREWAPYVSVASKIARGRAAAKKLAAKEKRSPCPVRIEGRKIAKTFWGIKWCENLERYRDFSNRLPRGATYARNGSVADLVVEPGRVRAIVGGSEAYRIEIKIQTLKPKVWQAISRDCAQEIDSLFDLLQGRFQEGVMQRLTQADGGLFPKPSEISMSCSCPDSAGVCKHIAATFYGVAAILDKQPELLFRLRNVDHLELIGHATSAANLEQALGGAPGTTLSDGDLSSIFGIDIESGNDRATAPAKQSSKRRGKTARQESSADIPTVPTAEPTPSSRKRRSPSAPPADSTSRRAAVKTAVKHAAKAAASSPKASQRSKRTLQAKKRKTVNSNG